ncbi:MAG: PA domain-containing protein [Caldimonas sp.]
MTTIQRFLSSVGVAVLAAATFATQAATIIITSRDPAGVGFNDPTPVAPVGGNSGTTLGEQRFKVYRYVADIWEANIQSTVPITVSAGWEALTCTATSAVLGSAGAWNIWYDFPNGVPTTWYPQALANKLAGVNLSAGIPDDGSGYGTVDIKTQFNVNLGNVGCLDNTSFYLGLDGNAGSKVNFVETLLHELGHGLGFSVLTVQTSTGNRLNADGTAFVANGGLPSVWEGFMFDNTAGKTWLAMTSLERKASAINPLKLVWIGPQAVAGAAATLGPVPSIRIDTSVPGVAGFYNYNTASFGPPVSNPSAFGILANVPADPVNGAGCLPFAPAVVAAVMGKIALIDRGSCGFAVKTKNAQNAGAFGVIIVNNAAGAAPGLGGSDPTITIPAISVSQADGAVLKQAVVDAVKFGSRSRPGSVVASLAFDATRKAGADPAGRPLLYTPNPLASGSSVSHWDVSAFPNLLMEPNINSDLTTTLVPPKDITVPLLKDIGW